MNQDVFNYAYKKNHNELNAENQLQLISKGTYKHCYTNPYVNFVFLVEKDALLKDDLLERIKEVKRDKQMAKKFKQQNISCANILGFFADGFDFVTVQEKIKGTPVYIIDLPSAKTMLKHSNPNLNVTDQDVLHYAYKFNLNSQKMLIEANQKHFDKLLKDMFNLRDKFGINLYDAHAENFIFEPETGFTFIDLEPKRQLHLYRNVDLVVNTIEMLTSYYSKFSIDGFNLKYMEYAQVEKELRDNNLKIFNKVITAVKNNNIHLFKKDIDSVRKAADPFVPLKDKVEFKKNMNEVFLK